MKQPTVKLRRLTREELQGFAIGYVDYSLDTNGEYDWSKPKFTKGRITLVMQEIANKQLSLVKQDLEKQGIKVEVIE